MWSTKSWLRCLPQIKYSVIRWILISSIHVFISLNYVFRFSAHGVEMGHELISRYLQMAVEKKNTIYSRPGNIFYIALPVYVCLWEFRLNIKTKQKGWETLNSGFNKRTVSSTSTNNYMQSNPSYGVLLLFRCVSFPENEYSNIANKTICKVRVGVALSGQDWSNNMYKPDVSFTHWISYISCIMSTASRSR